MEVYVLLVIILATAVVLAALVATMYYVFKRVTAVQPPSLNGTKILDPVSSLSSLPSDGAATKLETEVSTYPTRATYTVVLNMNKFEKADNPRIIFARMNQNATDPSAKIKAGTVADNADMVMYMDPSRNDLLIAFAVEGVDATASFADSFCIFSVENVPIYTWTVIHVVYDRDAHNAKVYIDGKLRKVLNLFVCNGRLVRSHTGKFFAWGRTLDAINGTIAEKWKIKDTSVLAKYAAITMHQRVLSAAEVANEATKYLRWIDRMQKQSAADAARNNANTCSSGP